MNLKFPSVRVERIQAVGLYRALPGPVRHPVPTPLVHPWTREKTDYYRLSVRSYLHDGQTGRFGTLPKMDPLNCLATRKYSVMRFRLWFKIGMGYSFPSSKYVEKEMWRQKCECCWEEKKLVFLCCSTSFLIHEIKYSRRSRVHQLDFASRVRFPVICCARAWCRLTETNVSEESVQIFKLFFKAISIQNS